MNRAMLASTLLGTVVASFFLGSWFTRTTAKGKDSPGRKVLYYVDPMHPAYKSDKPGVAPDCGMQLEPVYADGGSPAGDTDHDPATWEKRAVAISAEKQQLIGVRIGAVERAPLAHTIRTVGRVATDEARIYRINLATDGWIRRVYPPTTGSLVQKDELLAAFFSSDFVTAEQAYFYALGTRDRLAADPARTPEQLALVEAQVRTGEAGLLNLGMGEPQIRDLGRTRELTQDILVQAPVTGFVIARNVSPGLRFDRGVELYRVADLSRIWILADLFEDEATFFRPGATAHVSLPSSPGRVYEATVSKVLPQFDPTTRTLKVRLETDNPGFTLRPDMFVDVELPVTLPAAVTLPADAVLDTGLRKTVFVDRGSGFFEPRKVETGWRIGDRVEIVRGLMPGERVVMSGNFLIDSESRFKAAAAGMAGEESEDPVCGMEVSEDKARAEGKTSLFEGRTYFFCSTGCKAKFDSDPQKYR